MFDTGNMTFAETLHASSDMTREQAVLEALSLRGEGQKRLFAAARQRRKEFFPGETVEVRSVIELSNVCRQKCRFCGMNSYSGLTRYMVGEEEFLKVVETIYRKGRRVLLVQSGENPSRSYIDLVCRCLDRVRRRFSDLTVILCLGNLSFTQYRQLKDSGADRYILKFETSNPKFYKQIKPGDSLETRTECLHQLVDLGFGVGTGNIVGLPGQTMEDIVSDLFYFSRFRLRMASCTVFIPGLSTDFEKMPYGDTDLALNFMALLRITYPALLMPTTSSLEKARKGGQFLGLQAGANSVTVHDGTPRDLKKRFPIYSAKRFAPNEKHIAHIVKKAGLKFAAGSL